MASVSFVAADQTYTTGTALALTPPTGTAVGDFVVAFFGVGDGDATLTGGAGFSTETSVGGGGGIILAAFYRQMTAAGDLSTSFQFTSDKNDRMTLGFLTLRGMSSVDPIPNSATWESGAKITTANAPSVTATRANSLLVCCFANKVEDGAWSTPVGMDERIDYPYSAVSGAPFMQLGVDTLSVNVGATGIKTAALSTTPNDGPLAISLIANPVVTTGAALFGINT